MVLVLSACGGGGGGSGDSNQPPPSNNTQQPPSNTITSSDLLSTGDDEVQAGTELTLEEPTLVLGAQDKLTINGILTIEGQE